MSVRRKVFLIFACLSFFLLGGIVLRGGVIFFKETELLKDLAGKINTLSEDFKGRSSYVVKELTFPFLEISNAGEKEFTAASVIKLPIMAVAFQAVKERKLSLEDTFTIERRDIAGGSGILKAAKLPKEITFLQIIELMISKSDNTATNKIIDILGYDYINRVFKELELHDTSLSRKMMDFASRRNGKENYTSCGDLNMLLQKIYAKKLIDRESSGFMLSFLKKQKINDRIPRFLPKEEVIIAHKTGLERHAVHDCGIIFSPQRDYVICVLTAPQGNKYAPAKNFIAQISKLVYETIIEGNRVTAK